MPTTVSVHQLKDLAQAEDKNSIILETNLNTNLHISGGNGITMISFPFGNKFDIINNRIVIHEK